MIDPSNGSVKATSVPAVTRNYPVAELPPAMAASQDDPKAATVAAKHASEIADVELEMITIERKLAQQRADLQHQVRQMETRRARLARKLDALPADGNSDDRAKLTAQLEETEDQLASTQHEVDVFEAELEFKVRELELKRNQLLRSNAADPFSTSSPAIQPMRSPTTMVQR